MTRTLPQTAVGILAGCVAAEDIARDLHAAFWLHGHNASTSLFLWKKAHESLAALADAMGYTLTPKVEEEAAEAAA